MAIHERIFLTGSVLHSVTLTFASISIGQVVICTDLILYSFAKDSRISNRQVIATSSQVSSIFSIANGLEPILKCIAENYDIEAALAWRDRNAKVISTYNGMTIIVYKLIHRCAKYQIHTNISTMHVTCAISKYLSRHFMDIF